MQGRGHSETRTKGRRTLRERGSYEKIESTFSVERLSLTETSVTTFL